MLTSLFNSKHAEEKIFTLSPDQAEALFLAKQKDLQLPESEEQRLRFIKVCSSQCLQGRILFCEMQLQVNFAAVVNGIFLENPQQRITHLNLSRNSLGDQGAILVTQAVKHSTAIVYLNIASNEIGPNGMQFVFDELVYNESLAQMDIGTDDGFNRNRVSPRNYAAVRKFVFTNKFVSIYGLKGIALDGEGFAAILRCLEEVSARHQALLEEVAETKDDDIAQLEKDYTRPGGDNTALEYVLKARRKYQKEPELPDVERLPVQSLDVSFNDILLTMRHHHPLFSRALVYSDVRELDLSYNKLGDEGIKVVAGALSVRSRLQRLNLTCCDFRLETTGGYQLLSALSKNHSLLHITLDRNNLFGQRPTIFKDLFTANQSLQSMSMNHCKIGRMGSLFIADGLGRSKSLVSLALGHNDIMDYGGEKIARAFNDREVNLEHLNLAGNNLTDKSGAALAQAMLGNQTLRSIDLRSNDLTTQTAALLQPVLLRN